MRIHGNISVSNFYFNRKVCSYKESFDFDVEFDLDFLDDYYPSHPQNVRHNLRPYAPVALSLKKLEALSSGFSTNIKNATQEFLQKTSLSSQLPQFNSSRAYIENEVSYDSDLDYYYFQLLIDPNNHLDPDQCFAPDQCLDIDLIPFEARNNICSGGQKKLYEVFVDRHYLSRLEHVGIPILDVGDPTFVQINFLFVVMLDRGRIVSNEKLLGFQYLPSIISEDGKYALAKRGIGNGRTLIKRSFGEKLEVAVQVALDINQLHLRDIAHLDVKLGNVVVGLSGPSVIDLDVSKPLGAEPVKAIGTRLFMAPEVQSASVDAPFVVSGAQDVYSFGLMLHELDIFQFDHDLSPSDFDVILEKLYQLSLDCGQVTVSQRPTMPIILKRLTDIHHLYIELKMNFLSLEFNLLFEEILKLQDFHFLDYDHYFILNNLAKCQVDFAKLYVKFNLLYKNVMTQNKYDVLSLVDLGDENKANELEKINQSMAHLYALEKRISEFLHQFQPMLEPSYSFSICSDDNSQHSSKQSFNQNSKNLHSKVPVHSAHEASIHSATVASSKSVSTMGSGLSEFYFSENVSCKRSLDISNPEKAAKRLRSISSQYLVDEESDDDEDFFVEPTSPS